jgi:transcription termination factor Rho
MPTKVKITTAKDKKAVKTADDLVGSSEEDLTQGVKEEAVLIEEKTEDSEKETVVEVKDVEAKPEQKSENEVIEKENREESKPAYYDSPRGNYSHFKEPKIEQAYEVSGYLDIQPEGHGFLRPKFIPSHKDIYISQSQIRRFMLRSGDMIE